MELNVFGQTQPGSAIQEIPRILLKPKVHYQVHNSPPLVPIMSENNLVHVLRTYFFKIYFIIILPSTSSSSKLSLPSHFLKKKKLCMLCFFMCAKCPVHLILLESPAS
jgi:hypothetical protein